MSFGNASSSKWGPKVRTVAEHSTEMTMFLYQCTDQRLAAVTVDNLVARHGLDAKDCEYALTIARQKRAS